MELKTTLSPDVLLLLADTITYLSLCVPYLDLNFPKCTPSRPRILRPCQLRLLWTRTFGHQSICSLTHVNM